jgi:superfamily II DNA helicase RecQ
MDMVKRTKKQKLLDSQKRRSKQIKEQLNVSKEQIAKKVSIVNNQIKEVSIDKNTQEKSPEKKNYMKKVKKVPSATEEEVSQSFLKELKRNSLIILAVLIVEVMIYYSLSSNILNINQYLPIAF